MAKHFLKTGLVKLIFVKKQKIEHFVRREKEKEKKLEQMLRPQEVSVITLHTKKRNER
jgi:hypothetical protein